LPERRASDAKVSGGKDKIIGIASAATRLVGASTKADEVADYVVEKPALVTRKAGIMAGVAQFKRALIRVSSVSTGKEERSLHDRSPENDN